MTTSNYGYYECEFYDDEGSDYSEAWNIMRESIKIPPSLEVFQRGLGDSSPQDYAEYLVSRRKR